MPILDTNPVSILERRNAEAARLSAFLKTFPNDSIYVTVISYEEQDSRLDGGTRLSTHSSRTDFALYQVARTTRKLL